MIEIHCRKNKGSIGLVPETRFDLDQLQSLPANKSLKCKITQSRNDSQQRLYWRILALVVHNTDWPSAEALHHYLRVKTGRVDYIKVTETETHIVPKSTSYGAMDNTEFASYLYDALNAIVTHVMPGTTIAELKSNIGET